MRTALALAVCLLLLALGRAVAADDLAAALVAGAGEDVLGYLRVENPKTLLDKLDAVTARTGNRSSDDLPLFAQRFLKNPLLLGIEMKQPWTFIFLNPRRYTNNLAVVVGVSDAAVFCDSFGKGGVSNVKADPATAGAAIRHFSETEDTYDHAAYVAALRAGKKVEPILFKKQVTKQYYVTTRDGQGLIVGRTSLLDKLGSGSKLGHDIVHGDLVVAARMPGILSLYEKDLRQQKESILEALGVLTRASSGETAGPATPSFKTPAAVFDIALNLARQIAWIEAAAELGGGQLKLRVAALPQANTVFGRALAGQQPLELDGPLMSLLPANVAMLGAMRFTRNQDWTRLLMEMMQPAFEPGTGSGNADAAAKDREIFRALVEPWGGGVAEAVLMPATNTPPSNVSAETDASAKNTPGSVQASAVNVVEVLRVTNAAQARQARRKAVEAGLAVDRAGSPPETPARMKYETNVAKHAGVEIDRITMDAAVSAAPENTAGFIQQMAFVGSFQLMAQGPDSTNNIRRLIAAAKKSSASGMSPELKAVTASFPRKHNGFFCMNLADYVALIRSASPAAGDDPQLRKIQTQLAEARVWQTGWLLLQPRAASVELVVPFDQLVGIVVKDAAPATR